MHKLALLVGGGVLALTAGFVVTVETSDAAHAQKHRGMRGMAHVAMGRPTFHRPRNVVVGGGMGSNFRSVGMAGQFRVHVRMGGPNFRGQTFQGQTFQGMGGMGLTPGPNRRVFTNPGGGGLSNRGPGPFGMGVAARRPPGNITRVNRAVVTIFRGPRFVFWRGGVRRLGPAALIGGIFIGGVFFQPDGFVVLAQPVCRGVTQEGCTLRWQNVVADDGQVVAQCVQFCPRQQGEQPQQVADDPTAPNPPAAQGCQVSIFSQVNFGGVSADATTDQPELTAAGWDKQISSLEVKTGTWDFFTEANFAGQSARYETGRYEQLQQWDRQFSSFMCVQN